MAGLNAACRAGGAQPDRVLHRGEAYIGVLVDDLVLQGVTEPYRMLTARSEYRLGLRADNAGLRLTEKGIAWGCVGPERAAAHRAFAAAVSEALARARQEGATPARNTPRPVSPVNQDGRWRSALEALGPAGHDRRGGRRGCFPGCATCRRGCGPSWKPQALYAPYLERQAAELRAAGAGGAAGHPGRARISPRYPACRRDAAAARHGLARPRSAAPAGCPASPRPPSPPWPSICAGPRRVSRETGRSRRPVECFT